MFISDEEPAGREMLFARGLHAGLTGDFVVAMHLSLPQVENSLRHMLAQRGVVVTKLVDGIEDVVFLHELLDARGTYRPLLEEMFGEDTIFDLEGLLVRRFGANLRNRSAHGLMDYEQIQSVEGIYSWWLVLRLCVAALIGPQIAARRRKEEEQQGDDGPGRSDAEGFE